MIHNQKTENEKKISPILLLLSKLDDIPKYINMLILIVSMIIFDSLYIILCNIDVKGNYYSLTLLINIFDLLYFRFFILIFYTLLFTLPNPYFFSSFVISLPHAYLIINYFSYNHLYYYVPEFIDYPYDEFSSIFDLFLFTIKIIFSISSVINNADLEKFFFIISVFLQIVFCFYIIDKLIHNSYLFMKNTFLNKIKIALFFSHITIVFASIFILKKNNFNFTYFLINILITVIYMGIFLLAYDPFSFINIKCKSSIDNILYYLNIINERNDIKFLIENKLFKHYRDCGICNLCKKYKNYKNNNNSNNDEKDLLLNDSIKINDGDLFNIIYDENKKYFKLIRKIEKSKLIIKNMD